MTLHNHLQKLLIANCLSKVKDGSISLKGGQGKNQYPVELTGMDTKNISVINLGKGPHSSLIGKDGDYNKICDYLILIPQQNAKAVALFCELKKTYKQTGGDQLYSSVPFMDYIQSMLHIHFNENRQFNHKFIIIACKMASRLDKQGVRPAPIQKEAIDFEKKIKITLILGETIPFKEMLL